MSLGNLIKNVATDVVVHAVKEGGRATQTVMTARIDQKVAQVVRNGSRSQYDDDDVIEAEIVESGEEYSKALRETFAAFNRMNDDEIDTFIELMYERYPRDEDEDEDEDDNEFQLVANHGSNLTDLDEGVDYDTDDNQSILPTVFDIGDEKLNLEAAATARRLWGCTELNDNFTLIAQSTVDKTCFVGTLSQLVEYCKHNDLDVDWVFHGLNERNEFTNDGFQNLTVSREAIVYVSSLSKMRSEESEKNFKKFHWNKNEKIINVVKSIPGLEGTNLSMMGVAHAIIYYANKGDEQQVFIHEFGEDSGKKPTMYSMPASPGDKYPKTIVIHGGEMRVEPKGIVD
jgi:hypothetical protein